MAIFYKGHDNLACLQLKQTDCASGQVSNTDLSGVNKADIFFNGKNYSSDDHPGAFDWTIDPANGRLDLRLGIIPDIDVAKDSKSELKIYDPSNPNGVVWGLLYIAMRAVQ